MAATRYSILLAVLGVMTFVGASMAFGVGTRFGARRVVLTGRVFYAAAWVVRAMGLVAGLGQVTVFAAQALFGLALGIENANEMALWQSRTPDHLLGRVNGSRRSMNRTMAAVGAVLAGVLIASAGMEATVMVVAVLFGVAARVVVPANVRTAEPDHH